MASSLVEWDSLHSQIRRCVHWLHLEVIFSVRQILRWESWVPLTLVAEATQAGAPRHTSIVEGPVHQLLVCSEIGKRQQNTVLLAPISYRAPVLTLYRCAA